MVKKHSADTKSGFTLIEIVVATGIVLTVMVGISAGVTFAVKNSRFSQEKSQTVRLASESLEWARGQRDILGWAAFSQILSQDNASEVVYCISTLPSTTEEFIEKTNLFNQDCPVIPDTKFVRTLEISLDASPPTKLELVSRVKWLDDPENNETILNTTLRKW